MQLSNITADENGAVFINIDAGGASPYGYIGALVIQGYTSGSTGTGGGGGTGRSLIPEIPAPLITTTATPVIPVQVSTQPASRGGIEVQEVSENSIAVYPNPFNDDVTLKMALTAPAAKLTVIVTDASGRIVFRRELGNVASGINTFKLGLSGNRMPPGIYFIRMTGLPGEKYETIRLLKVNK